MAMVGLVWDRLDLVVWIPFGFAAVDVALVGPGLGLGLGLGAQSELVPHRDEGKRLHPEEHHGSLARHH